MPQIYNQKMNNPRKKLKIKLCETILKELSTRKNDAAYNGGSATVYLGDKWVKKIAVLGEFSEANIFQYELMSKNPEIFPTTKIKKFEKGVVILQKRVDTNSAEKIYYEIQKHLDLFEYYSFREFLEGIVKEGFIEEYKYIYTQNWKHFRRIEIGSRFKEIVTLCVKLHDLLKKNPFTGFHRIDLHDENFGVEDGKLKIIDFMV